MHSLTQWQKCERIETASSQGSMVYRVRQLIEPLSDICFLYLFSLYGIFCKVVEGYFDCTDVRHPLKERYDPFLHPKLTYLFSSNWRNAVVRTSIARLHFCNLLCSRLIFRNDLPQSPLYAIL